MMDSLSAAASIIAVVQITTSVIGYLNDIKSAPDECSDASIELSNLNTLLLKLKKEFTKTNSKELWHEEIEALAVKDGALDQYKAAIEKLSEKINPTSKFRKTLNNLVWSLIKDDVATTMTRLHRLMTLSPDFSVESDSNLSRAIKYDTAAIKKDTTALANAQNNRQYEEMLTWLSRVDFFSQKNGIIADRYETTGTWFLNTTEIQQWLSQDRQTLYCQGIPGAGKSMMAAIVIDHLCQTVRSKDVEIVCIFCDYKTTFEQSTSELLAAALKQLVPGRDDTLIESNKIYQKCLQERRKPSRAELVETLKAVCGKYQTVYIVVDALDECSNESGTRTQLIHDLQQLQILSDLRLLYTSRVVPEIERESKWSLKMDLSAMEDDVRRFVRGKMPTLPAFILRDEELSRQVENRIAEATDGMFLLARLYIESLRAATTKKIAKSRLADFQKRTIQGNRTDGYMENQALKAAYKDALDRIERQQDGYGNLARSALSWIIYARRHLTTKQLREALAIEIGECSLDPDNMPSMEDVVSACTGLVLVDDTIGVVRLVHYTTEEFFARERLAWIPEAEQHIAKACLTYMSFEIFRTGPCGSAETFKQRMNDNSLATYFMEFFGEHLRPVENQLRKFCRLHGFLHDRFLVEAVWRIWRTGDDIRRYIQIRDTKPNILHLLAACGLETLGEEALIDGVEPDPLDENCRTPLSWAACNGHEAIVKMLLLRDDVCVDSRDDFGQTPLSRAAEHGHEAVVKLLLARDDVHANSRDKGGQTPLWWAVVLGHEAVVKLLLARDEVHADSEDEAGHTSLSLAAENGHEAVLRLLLAQDDVRADSRDEAGQTPLSLAAQFGHDTVVMLLLARDDVQADSRDRDGRTPLSWAAGYGHEAVVKLLLARKDVCADSRDEHGRTPLSWASSCEDRLIAWAAHDQVVKLLLEQSDVDVNSLDNDGRTPLSWALESGEDAGLQNDKVRAVVRLLELASASNKVDID